MNFKNAILFVTILIFLKKKLVSASMTHGDNTYMMLYMLKMDM